MLVCPNALSYKFYEKFEMQISWFSDPLADWDNKVCLGSKVPVKDLDFNLGLNMGIDLESILRV